MGIIRPKAVVHPERGLLAPPKVSKEAVDGGLWDGPKRKNVIVGVDSSATAPGICFMDVAAGDFYAYVHRSKFKGEDRLVDIERWVSSIYNRAKLRANVIHGIVMEGYGFNTQMAHTIGEVGGIIKKEGRRNLGHYSLPIAPSSLKKFTTGSGGKEIKKQQMLLAIYRKWGVEFMDDNMGEAFALCKVGQALLTGVTENAYEAELINKLETPPSWVPMEKTS
jgi:hypothetical protein